MFVLTLYFYFFAKYAFFTIISIHKIHIDIESKYYDNIANILNFKFIATKINSCIKACNT